MFVNGHLMIPDFGVDVLVEGHDGNINKGSHVSIMKQFEYKVISSVVGTEKKLNKLGFEGWELVAVFDCRLYLKREYKI